MVIQCSPFWSNISGACLSSIATALQDGTPELEEAIIWEGEASRVLQAVKVVEMLRPSNIEARKQLLNEFDIYISMEKAYQSGKLRDRIALHCYGAYARALRVCI